MRMKCVASTCVLAFALTSGSYVGHVMADDSLPDLTKTPGASRPGLTKSKICSIRWGRDERHVTETMKRQVFADSGYSGYDDPLCVADSHGKRCEIDHLVSRELGGADEIANLWPQSYGGAPWNAHIKVKLENRLHREKCAGRISLAQARALLVSDWRKAYERYFGAP
jgi:hypothetical protein